MMDHETWLKSLLSVIRDLADEQHQERVWVRGQGPESDSSTGAICRLFNDYDVEGFLAACFDERLLSKHQREALQTFAVAAKQFADQDDDRGAMRLAARPPNGASFAPSLSERSNPLPPWVVPGSGKSAMQDLPYDPETDTLLIELRPWPSPSPAEVNENVGGEDAGESLVIHYGPDGLPHAVEVEHASERPDLVARALAALCAAKGSAASADVPTRRSPAPRTTRWRDRRVSGSRRERQLFLPVTA